MRLIALLSFYDEPTNFLRAYVDGLKVAGARELVALDGAYALYPGGRAESAPEQHRALIDSCQHADIRLRLHKPATVWDYGEVGKRSDLMCIGDQYAETGDWLLILDADEHVLAAPRDLVPGLNRQPLDVATIALRRQDSMHGPSDRDATTRERRLMRSGLGTTVVANHATYITADGTVLWSAGRDELQAPAHDVAELDVVHMTRHRPEARRNAQGEYYSARHIANAEAPYRP